MSHIGKKPVAIPQGVTISFDNDTILVKGPLGELSRPYPSHLIEMKINEDGVVVSPKTNDKESKPFWGTYTSHLKNMVEGVTKGFQKKLLIEGVGYKADVKGQDLVMSLGFSHQVIMPIPQNLKVVVEKSVAITISGIDKEAVGEFSAKIRSKKKPEPYKGKGIRYENEVIRRKRGKKSA